MFNILPLPHYEILLIVIICLKLESFKKTITYLLGYYSSWSKVYIICLWTLLSHLLIFINIKFKALGSTSHIHVHYPPIIHSSHAVNCVLHSTHIISEKSAPCIMLISTVYMFKSSLVPRLSKATRSSLLLGVANVRYTVEPLYFGPPN